MKKIKLLTSLVGLTGLFMGLVPMISGCSCAKQTPEKLKNVLLILQLKMVQWYRIN